MFRIAIKFIPYQHQHVVNVAQVKTKHQPFFSPAYGNNT